MPARAKAVSRRAPPSWVEAWQCAPRPGKRCDLFVRTWSAGVRGSRGDTSAGFRDTVHPEDVGRCDEAFARAVRRREAFRVEYRLVAPDGTARTVLDAGTPSLGPGGRLAGFAGTRVDITDRAKQDAAAVEGQECLRVLAELSRDTLFVATEDFTRILHTNSTGPAARPAPGPAGNPDAGWLGAVIGDDRPILRRLAQQLRSRPRRPVEAEVRVRWDKEPVTLLLLRCVWLPANRHEPARIAGFATDITEGHRVAEALRLSEERFHLAFEAANDGIFDWNLTDDTLFLSTRWKSMLGYSDKEVRDQRLEWRRRLHPDERDRVLRYLRDFLEGRIPAYKQEYRLRHKDGTYRWILARGLLIRDEKGRAVRMVGSHTDISAHKQQEQRLLEAADQERRRIGHELHDDLGQRFTAIELQSQALLDQLATTSPGSATIARRINRSIRDTISLVRKLSHGLAPMALHGPGLADALQELALYASDVSGIRVQFRCPRTPKVSDDGVGNHLYRIAQEAVTNALKHARGSRVDIRLEQRRNRLALLVKDDGRGFPRNRPVNGRGLGILRQRASLIGATLEVQSRAGSGVHISCIMKTL